MSCGVKLLNLELGPKKSKKYERLYNGIHERISKKLLKSNSNNELELIKKFMEAKSEFDKYKPKNKNNELFHTSLRKFSFNNYNTFFLMRDCLSKYNISVNLFTEKGIYYVKTNNYLIFDKKIFEIDNYNRKESDFFVLSENLIYVNTYRRLSNLYKLINSEKASEYEKTMNKIIDKYHNINEVLKLNYSKLDFDIIDLITKGEENYEINFLQGNIFMKQKKYRLAEEEYRKVLPYDKAYIDLYFRIAQCLSYQNKHKEALKFYNEILDKDYEVLFNIGYAYYKLNNIDKAIEYFTQTILINERCKEAYLNLSVCYMKQFSFDNARKTILKGIKNIGMNKDFENTLLRIKERQAKYSEINIFIENDGSYRTNREVKA